MPEKRSPARLVSGHFQQQHQQQPPQQQTSTPPQRPRGAVADSATSEDQCHPRKIFIGGLAHKTTTQHLRDYFVKFGSIVDAVVLRWPDGRSRGFGYVTFGDVNSANQALRLQHNVGGRQVDTKRAVPGTNKLFVGGLPQNTTATELREHFEKFGVVSDAVVMMDPTTNRSRGFGFVCFLPGAEGASAVACSLDQYQNHRIRGKWIEVKSAAPPHKLASKEGGTPSDGEPPELACSQELAPPPMAYPMPFQHPIPMRACPPPGLGEPAKVTLTDGAAAVPITMGTTAASPPCALPPGLEGLPGMQKRGKPDVAHAVAYPGFGAGAAVSTTTNFGHWANQDNRGGKHNKIPGGLMNTESWGAASPPSTDRNGLFTTSADLRSSLEQLLRLESIRKEAELRSKEPVSTSSTTADSECSSVTQDDSAACTPTIQAH